ncbi:hypothetical protein PWG15_24350 (plasmid) [Ensifer adhaerens]|nr:hypothetical protein [Ensifer adhaerens]WDZ80887.1 hypothetical protein PWG15_24350 [Ensifer adhaerens]
MLDEIVDFGERLIDVVDRICEFGIPQEVIDRAMQNASVIAKRAIGACG